MTTTKLQGPRVVDAKRLLKIQREKGWIPLVLKHGKNFWFQGSLSTCDPVLIQTLLMHRTHTQQRSVIYKLMSRIFPGAPGVLFMDGEEWQQHIHAVMPVFTKTNIDTYAETIHNTAVEYAAQWRDGQHLDDLYTSITELGMRVIMRCGYGLDPEGDLGSQLGRELIGYKAHTMTSPYRIDSYGLGIDELKILPGLVTDIWQLKGYMTRIRKLIQAVIDERQTANYKGLDWIQQLSSERFPLPQIADEINHIYGAFNAIDYTVTCALYQLSKQPNWINIIRDEFKQVLGDRSYPTREDFDSLPNTTHFMKEIFRHYPVAIGVIRRIGEAIEVEGETLPAGKEVIILLYALHHHPDFWDHPDEFNPDRWKTPPIQGTYIPFLIGPRQCIGRHLAELHFMVTLHALLGCYDFEVLDPDVPVGPYFIPRFERAIPCIVHRSPEEVL